MKLTGKAKIAGVMGWPISHTRSPRLHGYWLDKYRIDGAYVPFAVPPERIEQAIHALPALGLRGANVTVPYKETAARAVDRLDEAARRTGAVNCIVVDNDGSLEGRNTDAYGFVTHLTTSARNWRADGGPAVVIGAGGAARAIVFGLIEAGVPEIRLVNRTRDRSEVLAEAIGGPITVIDWVSRETSLDDANLLVNTTTLGMAGQPALTLDLERLPELATVADIVYTPLLTPLLAAAKARGNTIVDGLGMLLHQARPAFATWFGIDPEVDEDLRRFVMAE